MTLAQGDPQTQSPDFESAYAAALEALASQSSGSVEIRGLRLAEEARENSGSDGYQPEWMPLFSSIASHLIGGGAQSTAAFFRGALTRAAQLGYTEGYFAGKDD